MSTIEDLSFDLSKNEQDLIDLYNYNVDVFAESPDFKWCVERITEHFNDGWSVYSVRCGDEIVAGAFLKKDEAKLLTQNTPIKMAFQGNGFSHRIKDFFEIEAKKLQTTKVVNICPVDNFRMIALNESHGYEKTGRMLGENKSLIEWEKNLE